MRYKGAIFDLFHTLTGLESEWSDLPLTSEVLGVNRQAWNDLLISRSRWRLAGEERDPIAIVTALAHDLDPTISLDVIEKAAEIRVRRFRHSLMNIPPVNVKVLKHLRGNGLRLGLISNADAMEVAAWGDSPLAGLFDSEIFSCEIGCVKPEPAVYRACLTALGVEASECMFVGDGGSDELTGAKQAGLTTVFISGIISELWPERIAERIELADHHVSRLEEILPIAGLSAPMSDDVNAADGRLP